MKKVLISLVVWFVILANIWLWSGQLTTVPIEHRIDYEPPIIDTTNLVDGIVEDESGFSRIVVLKWRLENRNKKFNEVIKLLQIVIVLSSIVIFLFWWLKRWSKVYDVTRSFCIWIILLFLYRLFVQQVGTNVAYTDIVLVQETKNFDTILVKVLILIEQFGLVLLTYIFLRLKRYFSLSKLKKVRYTIQKWSIKYWFIFSPLQEFVDYILAKKEDTVYSPETYIYWITILASFISSLVGFLLYLNFDFIYSLLDWNSSVLFIVQNLFDLSWLVFIWFILWIVFIVSLLCKFYVLWKVFWFSNTESDHTIPYEIIQSLSFKVLGITLLSTWLLLSRNFIFWIEYLLWFGVVDMFLLVVYMSKVEEKIIG